MISWTGKFNTIQKVSRPSGNFPDHPECFQTIQKVSRPSGKFPYHPETFQTIQKVFRPSGLSRPSGKFPDQPESFQTIWKVSRPSGKFELTILWPHSRLSYNDAIWFLKKIFFAGTELSFCSSLTPPKSWLILSGWFWNCPDGFENVRMVLKLSVWF